jgi:hypothetical protein
MGGYPYKYVSVSEMMETLPKLGFEMLQVRPSGVPTGCDGFVCGLIEKKNPGSENDR